MLPKFPINTTFDPAASDYAADLWNSPAGRILMLLWRPMHLCSQDWFSEARLIAKRIDVLRPLTSDELLECFEPSFRGHNLDFTREDSEEFCRLAIDFFTCKRHVPYVGVVSGNACMIRE
jgi:hypothetical protein